MFKTIAYGFICISKFVLEKNYMEITFYKLAFKHYKKDRLFELIQITLSQFLHKKVVTQ